MNKEELLGLGLSEEMVGKVLEKYEHMIPKARLDEVITERNDLREQITKRDEQLKELSEKVKDVKDIEELQKQITSLQEENKKVATDYETKISELRLSNAVETELMRVGALNTKAVRALLDNGKLKIEDGKLQGLSEQLAEIQKTDGYLFKAKEEPPMPSGVTPGAGNSENNSNNNVSLASALQAFYNK